MAVFPTGSPGVYPLDPETPIGQMRLILGDTESTPYDPVEAGFQNYEVFSDDELQALLTMSDDSFPRGVGYAYLKLAGLAANEAVDWRSDDLAMTLSKRSSELRLIAQSWFDRADMQDASEDIFDVFDTLGEDSWIPEGTIPIWGRRYVWDRVD